MPPRTLNPNVTHRDDGPYWAASLILALKAADRAKAVKARGQLRRLGYRVEISLPTKAVRHAR